MIIVERFFNMRIRYSVFVKIEVYFIYFLCFLSALPSNLYAQPFENTFYPKSEQDKNVRSIVMRANIDSCFSGKKISSVVNAHFLRIDSSISKEDTTVTLFFRHARLIHLDHGIFKSFVFDDTSTLGFTQQGHLRCLQEVQFTHYEVLPQILKDTDAEFLFYLGGGHLEMFVASRSGKIYVINFIRKAPFFKLSRLTEYIKTNWPLVEN